MRRHLGYTAAATALMAGLCGCGIGYNRMIFATTTNIGMNVDSKPPTAEINIARREVLIDPTFEGGKTLPVLGGVHYSGNFFAPNVAAVFAGGRAAATVGKLFTTTSTTISDSDAASQICVANLPDSRVLRFLGFLAERGDSVRPFFFATDTSTGLKVAWSGTTGNIPDTFRFGYNRKEFAFAPIFAQPNACDPERTGATHTGFLLESPSFLATLDSGFDASSLTGGTYDYAQFFATGKAADNLALQPSVRQALGKRIDVEAFGKVAKTLEQNRAEADALNTKVKDKITNATDPQLDDALAKARSAGLLTDVSFPANSTSKQKKDFIQSRTWASGDDPGRLDALRTFVNSLGS